MYQLLWRFDQYHGNFHVGHLHPYASTRHTCGVLFPTYFFSNRLFVVTSFFDDCDLGLKNFGITNVEMQNQQASFFRKGDLVVLHDKYLCKITAMNTTKSPGTAIHKILFIGTSISNGQQYKQLCTSDQMMMKPE